MGRFVKGFTLIEVMITVAIVAILAAVALPNYSNYITRSRLVEATDALSAGHTRMEQHFQDNRGYTSAPVCANPSPLNTKTFTVTCPEATAGAFRLLATGTGSMAGFTFTINQNRVRTSNHTASGWSTGGSVNCWVTKKGQSCS